MNNTINQKVTILDYGMCNLFNVVRAFEYCGANVTVTESPADVLNSERLVVPGVGAFFDSMREIHQRGFGDAIKSFVETGRPMFGICIGMQILFDLSDEFGEHAGLGILPGRVQAIPSVTSHGDKIRVPHIGWNQLIPSNGLNWSNTLLDPLENKLPAVYFVHSYSATPTRDQDRLADCMYGGHLICAAVQHENVMATQFHPERSGPAGLAIIKNFCTL